MFLLISHSSQLVLLIIRFIATILRVSIFFLLFEIIKKIFMKYYNRFVATLRRIYRLLNVKKRSEIDTNEDFDFIISEFLRRNEHQDKIID